MVSSDYSEWEEQLVMTRHRWAKVHVNEKVQRDQKSKKLHWRFPYMRCTAAIMEESSFGATYAPASLMGELKLGMLSQEVMEQEF